MNLILDSSVIGKMFIKEEGSDNVIELIRKSHIKKIELIASGLSVYEVGNIIYKTTQRKKIDSREYMESLFLININFIPINMFLACSAMGISTRRKITYYDAVHIALSEKYAAPLITEDKELLKKFNNTLNIKKTLEVIG